MVESQKNFALFALQINDCIEWNEANWVEYRGKQTGVCSFHQQLFTGLTTGSTWLRANLDQHSHTKPTNTVTQNQPCLQSHILTTGSTCLKSKSWPTQSHKTNQHSHTKPTLFTVTHLNHWVHLPKSKSWPTQSHKKQPCLQSHHTDLLYKHTKSTLRTVTLKSDLCTASVQRTTTEIKQTYLQSHQN